MVEPAVGHDVLCPLKGFERVEGHLVELPVDRSHVLLQRRELFLGPLHRAFRHLLDSAPASSGWGPVGPSRGEPRLFLGEISAAGKRHRCQGDRGQS